MMINENVKLS